MPFALAADPHVAGLIFGDGPIRAGQIGDSPRYRHGLRPIRRHGRRSVFKVRFPRYCSLDLLQERRIDERGTGADTKHSHAYPLTPPDIAGHTHIVTGVDHLQDGIAGSRTGPHIRPLGRLHVPVCGIDDVALFRYLLLRLLLLRLLSRRGVRPSRSDGERARQTWRDPSHASLPAPTVRTIIPARLYALFQTPSPHSHEQLPQCIWKSPQEGSDTTRPKRKQRKDFRITTELSGQRVWRLSKVPLKTAETASGSCAFPELSIMLEHRIDTERLPRTLKEAVSQWPWRPPYAQDWTAFHGELRHAHSAFCITGDLAQSHSTVSRNAEEEKHSIARAASPARRSRHSAVAPAGPEEREPGRKLAGGRRSG